MKTNLTSHLRIIWAIAAKDIREALVNRTTLAIIVGVAVLVLSNSALPLLTSLRSAPTAVVYDPGRSTLVRALAVRDDLRIGFTRSEDEMLATVGGSAELVLGLVIPEGFTQAPEGGAGYTLAGAVPHWARDEAVADLVAVWEQALTEASWQPVDIDVTGGATYPTHEEPGLAGMVVTGFTVALLTIGLAMVPHLLMEERETHTFETLMVSPARYGQIVAGKALAGLTYGMTAGIVVLLLNARWIVSWWVVLLAIVLGSAFAVALGLLLGVVFRSSGALAAWASVLLALLLLPALVLGFGDTGFPAWIQAALKWLPSVAVTDLAWGALLRSPADAALARPIALLVGSTLALFILVTWRIRREGQR